jgi:hypothetical protein
MKDFLMEVIVPAALGSIGVTVMVASLGLLSGCANDPYAVQMAYGVGQGLQNGAQVYAQHTYYVPPPVYLPPYPQMQPIQSPQLTTVIPRP